MGIQLRRMSNRDRDFYPLLGPFLARRGVEAELGGRVWDDDDRVWYVALDRGRAVGFCAARQARTHAVWSTAYVVPERRREGIYTSLWRMRESEFPGPVRATCTLASFGMFLRNGFVQHRRKGRFVEVRRDG